MKIIDINSHKEALGFINNDKKAYLLLIKSGSEISECALNNLLNTNSKSINTQLLVADVNKVRDIHTNYPVDSVPALLEFEEGKFKNVYKGCNDEKYYKSIFEHSFNSNNTGNSKNAKQVIVYSTPTCSWCNTLKSYLKEHNVKYRDIDVSKDEKMSAQMVKKSGQQGVPQTEINGRIIVGFDRTKINQMLDIKG